MEGTLALPVIYVEADNLPAGWEQAVVATWERGAQIATQYDKPQDPPSRDATLVLAVADPLAEPRIHRAMPGGIYDLEVYRQEVVDGIHDDWIDPEHGKWSYTYHERLAAYTSEPAAEPINQFEYMGDALTAAPHSRRAQAIIWKPGTDAGEEHPPCLQRLWCRIFDGQLVMAAHIRSNDAFKAAFMNMYAFTELQRILAERLSERLGRLIRVGQYNHIVDSFHIYGSYFEEFKGFLKTLEVRTFAQRTFTTEQVAPLLEEAREKIAASLDEATS